MERERLHSFKDFSNYVKHSETRATALSRATSQQKNVMPIATAPASISVVHQAFGYCSPSPRAEGKLMAYSIRFGNVPFGKIMVGSLPYQNEDVYFTTKSSSAVIRTASDMLLTGI